MKKRAFLQISFAWLFAIIAGIFILFLAIYGITKLIDTEQAIQDAKTGKEIGILLNPLETSFESATTSFLTFPVETRIYNKCNLYGNFGNQVIQVSQKSFDKWTKTNIDIEFPNKYIFSEKYIEGKKDYIFSKPFYFPFKVADLIYLTASSKKYCFSDAPEDIQDEILTLNQENLLLDNCQEDNIKICFGLDSDCDINVYYDDGSGYVEKTEDNFLTKSYFESNALMYAAIFADKNLYECQLKRLMQRTGSLALLYKDKSTFISQTAGCNANLNLLELNDLANNLESSADLAQMSYIAEDIQDKNKDNSQCRLW